MKCVNTLRPRQNGRHFTDDIFKCIFLNENVWIPIKVSLKFAPRGPINNYSIIGLGRPGAKPLSEQIMISLLTHICITRPQCVNVYLILCDKVVLCFGLNIAVILLPICKQRPCVRLHMESCTMIFTFLVLLKHFADNGLSISVHKCYRWHTLE